MSDMKYKTCKVCGYMYKSTGVCPVCKYNDAIDENGNCYDGNPDDYKIFWNNWLKERSLNILKN